MRQIKAIIDLSTLPWFLNSLSSIGNMTYKYAKHTNNHHLCKDNNNSLNWHNFALWFPQDVLDKIETRNLDIGLVLQREEAVYAALSMKHTVSEHEAIIKFFNIL